MILPAASADDVAFMQNHTMAATLLLKPRIAQTKQVHASNGPVCTVAPAITGTPTVGQTLTCAPGTWLNAPAFTYQWRRQSAGNITTGGTAATYVLTALDHGYAIECEVTGTNGAGAVTVKSNLVLVP